MRHKQPSHLYNGSFLNSLQTCQAVSPAAIADVTHRGSPPYKVQARPQVLHAAFQTACPRGRWHERWNPVYYLTAFVDWTIAFQQAGMVLNIPSLMLWYGSKDARFSPVSSRIGEGGGGREGEGGGGKGGGGPLAHCTSVLCSDLKLGAETSLASRWHCRPASSWACGLFSSPSMLQVTVLDSHREPL